MWKLSESGGQSPECRRVRPLLRALADGELGCREQREALAHLDACPDCGRQYERVQSLIQAVGSLPLDQPPPHLAADLQVRLAAHRRGAPPPVRVQRPRRRAWTAAGLAVAMAAAVVLQTGRVDAQEIARRASDRWRSVHSYSALFVSSGVYRGERRIFTQRQFFKRPSQFRLDTSQDYALSTYVDAGEVQHYLPGGEWQGRGPLLIVRPRLEGQEALPFPFGAESGAGGNLNLDEVYQRLRKGAQVELLGIDEVDSRRCYHLRITSHSPIGRRREIYEIWLDQQSYLPWRVSWFRDRENRIVTEARSLEIDVKLFPSDTFEAAPPPGTLRIEGDIDPHVLALPYRARISTGSEAAASASEEAWERSAALPFRVQMPEWLPARAGLVRVRHKTGHWLDAHWLLPKGDQIQVIKLVSQHADDAPLLEMPAGSRALPFSVNGKRQPGQIYEGDAPYRFAILQWRDGKTRTTLFASGLSHDELMRIAGSFRPAAARPSPSPDPQGTIAPPDLLASEPGAGAPEMAPLVTGPPPPHEPVDSPPMMPEMPDPFDAF